MIVPPALRIGTWQRFAESHCGLLNDEDWELICWISKLELLLLRAGCFDLS